jgi:hypothetical protein
MLILDKGFFSRNTASDDAVYRYTLDLEDAFALFMHSLIDSLVTFSRIPEGTSIPLDIYQGVGHPAYRTYHAREA